MPHTQYASVASSIREVQHKLDELWGHISVETRSYTGNLIVLTTHEHLPRIRPVLKSLDGRHAGRQIVGVLDGDNDLELHIELIKHANDFYIERLIVDASETQLQKAILPLLRPATINYVWWAAPSQPNTHLLAELSDIADQVIANSLVLDLAPSTQYALADLGWSRSAGWREALAQVFDNPDAAAQIPHLTDLKVMYAGKSDLAARLFAGFVADRLGWPDLHHVVFRAMSLSRSNGDLCGLELSGGDGGEISFSLTARDSSDQVDLHANWSHTRRHLEMTVPPMSLTEGLTRVMDRPQRRPIFERAWRLAKNSLASDKTN